MAPLTSVLSDTQRGWMTHAEWVIRERSIKIRTHLVIRKHIGQKGHLAIMPLASILCS